jgi:hypothetical protein
LPGDEGFDPERIDEEPERPQADPEPPSDDELLRSAKLQVEMESLRLRAKLPMTHEQEARIDERLQALDKELWDFVGEEHQEGP